MFGSSVKKVLDFRNSEVQYFHCRTSEPKRQEDRTAFRVHVRRSDLARGHERLEAIMPKALKPGTPAPSSGLYRNNVTRTEVTGVKGRPLPPTPARHQTYTLVDPAKHKR